MCLFAFLSFCLDITQMSEGSQVPKVTLCVQIIKWQSLTHWLTKVRYRAARAAKKFLNVQRIFILVLPRKVWKWFHPTRKNVKLHRSHPRPNSIGNRNDARLQRQNKMQLLWERIKALQQTSAVGGSVSVNAKYQVHNTTGPSTWYCSVETSTIVPSVTVLVPQAKPQTLYQH